MTAVNDCGSFCVCVVFVLFLFAEVYKWVPAGGNPAMHQHISGFIRRKRPAVYRCLFELTPQPILSQFSLNAYENSLKPPLNLASSDNYFKSYLKPRHTLYPIQGKYKQY